MKSIYVAASSQEAELASDLAKLLKNAGWRITHSWFQEFVVDGRVPGRDRDVPTDVRTSAAKTDIDAVLQASWLWLLVPQGSSVGAWVELGAAIASGRRIVVSGDWRRTIFSELAALKFETHSHACQVLSRMEWR